MGFRSNLLRCWSIVILTLVVATVLPGTAESAVNVLEDSGWTAAVNEDWEIGVVVDDLTGDAVVIQIIKRFVGQPDEYGLMPAMYVEFIKSSEDAVGQIIITDEFITNDTTETWIDFHMELAVSIFDPEAGFSLDSDPSGDKFANVELSGSNGHNGLPTRIDFYNGLVPNASAAQDDFRPGYDSGSIIIIADPEMQLDQRIILKEFPTIPEPVTLGLFLAGCLVLLKRKSKTI